MCFVPGHPRAAGWVVGHLRRPNRAEEGQLPLLAPYQPEDSYLPEGIVPAPRVAPDDSSPVPIGPTPRSR